MQCGMHTRVFECGACDTARAGVHMWECLRGGRRRAAGCAALCPWV